MLGDVTLGLGLRMGVGLTDPSEAEGAAPSLPAPPPGEASGAGRPHSPPSRPSARLCTRALSVRDLVAAGRGPWRVLTRCVRNFRGLQAPGRVLSGEQGALVALAHTQHGRGKWTEGNLHAPGRQRPGVAPMGWGAGGWERGGMSGPCPLTPMILGEISKFLRVPQTSGPQKALVRGLGFLWVLLAAPQGREGREEPQETGWERPCQAPRRPG